MNWYQRILKESGINVDAYGHWLLPDGSNIEVGIMSHLDAAIEQGLDTYEDAEAAGWIRITTWGEQLAVDNRVSPNDIQKRALSSLIGQHFSRFPGTPVVIGYESYYNAREARGAIGLPPSLVASWYGRITLFKKSS